MNVFVLIAAIIVIVFYTLSLAFIFLYSITQAHLLLRYLFLKKSYKIKQQPNKPFSIPPNVTIQLPIYNEQYVAERLIDCVARLNYPKDKLEIQVLDDSTDDTYNIIAEKVGQLKSFVNIHHIHRSVRTGYKAGALREGLQKASGELIAIFDADFLPGEDFLQKTVPYFIDKNIGMVQTRWAWLNKSYSLLTRVQAFALDSHFSIEQVGRNIAESFINFNGTAGVWRKSCIIDAGNWQEDTLTEDLDLSYRAQLKQWRFIYLEEVGAPSELPPVMSAVKTQQYRWNKGGAETARKHLATVIRSSKPLLTRWHAMMHLLTSGVFICVFLFSVLTLPMLWIHNRLPQFAGLYQIGDFFFSGFYMLVLLFFASVAVQQKNKWKAIMEFLGTFPAFLSLSMGLSLHNTIAVLEGYFGRKTPFIRTPKFNVVAHSDQWVANKYLRKKINKLTIIEAVLSIYFLIGIYCSFHLRDFSLLPFQTLLALGYGAVVYLSLAQHGDTRLKRPWRVDKREAA
jgi:cellulose synthase/poly-beta-1,6-N-acetylglucosamine synthase-like glycosyltransferase